MHPRSRGRAAIWDMAAPQIFLESEMWVGRKDKWESRKVEQTQGSAEESTTNIADPKQLIHKELYKINTTMLGCILLIKILIN